MKRLLLTLAVGLLRLIYAPMRLLPLRRRVTIISRQSHRPSSDIRMLTEYLQEHHPDVECRVLIRFIEPGIGAKLSYLPHMLQQMVCLATSRVVILDGYCIIACVLPHKPQTRVIQMWHAVAAIKRFGHQTIGRPGGHSRVVAETLQMHRNYDMVLCPSEATGRIFCEGFDITPDKLVYMGLPRLDLVKNSASGTAKLRASYGVPKDKELVLYAPTFRKDKTVALEDLIRSIDPERFVLAVRLHPLDPGPEPGFEKLSPDLQIIVDTKRSTQRWISASDRVITDYSAIAVEAAMLDKPLYYYVYDIDEYEQSTGLNVDPRKELPQATARSAEELKQLLARPYDMEGLHQFRNKYITIDTKGCTARLGEFIYGIIEEVH